MSCFVIDAGGTPIRLHSGQALPLQNYFGAKESTILSKQGSPRTGLDFGLTCFDWLEPLL